MMSPEVPTVTSSSLQGKAALVTGGGRGIGRAICLQLARKGISAIAITYVGNKEAADEVAAQCISLGAKQAISIKADILDPNIGPDLIKAVLSGLNTTTLDIIINNAAIVDMTLNEPFESTTLEGFTRTLQLNKRQYLHPSNIDIGSAILGNPPPELALKRCTGHPGCNSLSTHRRRYSVRMGRFERESAAKRNH